MVDKVDPRTGELTTANYGWTKPTVGASTDAWGGYLNADLDGIDSIVHGLDTRVNDNRIINGDIRIDARNNGASGTALGYTVDRWQIGGNLTVKGTWGQNLSAAASAPGFPYYLGFSSAGTYTPAAGDTLVFQQPIEADAISDFQWGSSKAQPVTLSFWALYSVSGTLSGALRNYVGTRSYPFTYALTANTWTKIVITIPGDTAGTWVMSGNAGAMWLDFDLGSGATNRGPAGAWASASYVAVTGAGNVLAANGYLFLTGVKLEIGSVATPFNRQSLAKGLADCQRYYAITSAHALVSAIAASSYFSTTASLPVTMRATPTLTPLATMAADVNLSGLTCDTAYLNSFRVYATAVAVGVAAFDRTITASAEL
jgi:hypothetical protein